MRKRQQKREEQRRANTALAEKRFPMLKQARLQRQMQFQNRVQKRNTWRKNHPEEAAKKDQRGIDWVRQHVTFGGKRLPGSGFKKIVGKVNNAIMTYNKSMYGI